MANTESKIKITFDGSVSGLVEATAKAKAAIKSVSDETDKFKEFDKVASKLESGLKGVGKGLLSIGAASGAVSTIQGVASAAAVLAPAVLLIPGALSVAAAGLLAFKVGMSGFSDALKDGAAGAKAFAKLSDNAKDAVTAIKGLEPAWKDVKDTVQDSLFDGVAKEIKDLSGIYFPILKTGLTEITDEFNRSALDMAKAFKQAAFQDDIKNILASTASFFREIGSGFADLTSGIVGLGAVGATYLPRLGEAIGSVAARFKAWVDQGVESGAIEGFIDRAIAGFKDLGTILGNLGVIAGTVFEALSGGAASPLSSLAELTTVVRNLVTSPDGLAAFTAIGDTLRTVGGVVQDVLGEAFRQLAPVLVELAPVISEIAKQLGDFLVDALQRLGPLLLDAAKFLNDHKETVAQLAPLVLELVVAYKGLKVLQSVAKWADTATAALGKNATGIKGVAIQAAGLT